MASRPTHTIGTVVIAVILIIGLIVLIAVNHSNKTEQCRADGGTVHVDRDTKIKDGKRITTTEYECIAPDGRELYEW